MPVVINEFEVVQDAGAPPGSPAPVTPTNQQNSTPLPDVDRLLTSRHARELRVRAY